jgi:hypothetical protein
MGKILQHQVRFLLLFPVLCVAPLAFGQSGTISGTVVNTNGGAVANADVDLLLDQRGPDQQTKSGSDGTFSFSIIAPGPYRLTFHALGFAVKTLAGELHAGEGVTLPKIELTVAVRTSDMNVTASIAEIAEAQIKAEEKQRILGILPNFLANYDKNPAPLTAKQKFELTSKTFLDPVPFVIGGLVAGVGQAQNTHKGFGQGGDGYAKRYGAAMAEFATTDLLDHAVMPSLFRQDPRYFYKGTGSTGSRFWYAVSRSVICRGDNKKEQFCYSRVFSRVAASEISNLYYPAADRNSQGAVLQNAFLGIAGDAAGNLFREFIAPKLSRKKP